jgi:hypothetical protein
MEAATVTLLVGLASIAFAVWLCLPDVLFLLGLSRIHRGVIGGPETVDVGTMGSVSEELFFELHALGFSPAGAFWEMLPAHKMFREDVFVRARADCFARAYRLWKNDPPRASFLTVFSDGSIVNTKNYWGGLEVNEETIWAGGIGPRDDHTPTEQQPAADRNSRRAPWPVIAAVALWAGAAAALSVQGSEWMELWMLAGGIGYVVATLIGLSRAKAAPPADAPHDHATVRRPLAEVLAEHMQRVQHFMLAGRTPLPARTIEDALETEDIYYRHPTVLRELRVALVVAVVFKAAILAAVPLILSVQFGVDHPVPWCGLLITCLGTLFMRYFASPFVQAALGGKKRPSES